MATFLRRADRIERHAASIAEVERSFAGTFAAAGVALDGELARIAAEGTSGYPFLIQLIGYYLWQGPKRSRALWMLPPSAGR